VTLASALMAGTLPSLGWNSTKSRTMEACFHSSSFIVPSI